jgi:hypothetical protein
MSNVFSYLNSPPPASPAEPQHITQQDEGGGAPALPPELEQFDEQAKADLDNVDEDGKNEWVFPDPAAFPGGDPPQTPLDHLAAVAANVGTPCTQRHEDTANATATTPHPAHLGNLNQLGGNLGMDSTTATPAPSQRPRNTATNSALVATSQQDKAIKTASDLIAFLEWQSSRRGEVEEQKRFRDDPLAFPWLLVFATMRKKSPYIHLVHSAGVYPNIPGADPAWKGKAVGFLGDKTKLVVPQMIELGKTVAWAWDDLAICKDSTAMAAFYELPENKDKLWTPPGDAPRVRTVCPRMLALPPDCMAFCAEVRRTPAQLLGHITDILRGAGIDPHHYELALDWCCVVAHPGTGANSTSSVLSFAMPAILGSTDHLHEWAHNRLALTLVHSMEEDRAQGHGVRLNAPYASWESQTHPSGSVVEAGMLAQVTAAVVAAFRAGNGLDSTEATVRSSGKSTDKTKA